MLFKDSPETAEEDKGQVAGCVVEVWGGLTHAPSFVPVRRRRVGAVGALVQSMHGMLSREPGTREHETVPQ